MVLIYNGDLREVLKYHENDMFDAIVTDPPYGYGWFNTDSRNSISTYYDDIWAELFRVLKPGGFATVFGGDKTYHYIAGGLENAGFKVINTLAWIYGTGIVKKGSRLKPALELIALVKKPGKGELNIKACRFPVRGKEKPKFPVGEYSTDSAVGNVRSKERHDDKDPNTRYPSNVIISDDELLGDKAPYFYCARVSSKERGKIKHPSMKPQKLLNWLCKLVTPEDGLILDPFMGSGSTLISAMNCGFDGVGIELSPVFFEETKERIEAYFKLNKDDDNFKKLKEAFVKTYG